MDEETLFEPARQTVGDVVLSDFQRYQARLRVVGALSHVAGRRQNNVRITEEEAVIGRDASCDVVFLDDGVSRRHCRIIRTETEFILEDLGSSNGTYVDGVPIVSCTLHGGDCVQIGHSMFLFDSLLELQGEVIEGESAEQSGAPA